LKEGDAAFFVAGDPASSGSSPELARTPARRGIESGRQGPFELAWIVDFPMYEYNEEEKEGRLLAQPVPMPQGGLDALLGQDPLTINAFQYDITCNGYEIASGGIRNHRPEAMVKAFEIAGYGETDVVERFGGMLRAFQYGAPPHGGMAGRRRSHCHAALWHDQPTRNFAVSDEPACRGPADGHPRTSLRSSCASCTSGSICRKTRNRCAISKSQEQEIADFATGA